MPGVPSESFPSMDAHETEVGNVSLSPACWDVTLIATDVIKEKIRKFMKQ